MPWLSSSLARGGEAECSTPDSGGSVGAAPRAAVPSNPGSRPCPRRARGLGAPGSCSRPAWEPGKGPGRRPRGRGRGAGPSRSRPVPASRAQALPRSGPPRQDPRPIRSRRPGLPRPCAAGSGSGSSRGSDAEVGARKSGAQPGRLRPSRPAVRRLRVAASLPGRQSAGLAGGDPGVSREARRESPKSAQGAGRFPAEVFAGEESPLTSAFLPAGPGARIPPRATAPALRRERGARALPHFEGPPSLPRAPGWPLCRPAGVSDSWARESAPGLGVKAEAAAKPRWLLTACRQTLTQN